MSELAPRLKPRADLMPSSQCQHESRTGTGSRWLRFVRFYLEQGIKLWRMDPGGEVPGIGPSVCSGQLPLWSRLAQLFYVYFSLKLLVSLALQHQYNQLIRALALEEEENELPKDREAPVGEGANLTAIHSKWLGPGYLQKRAQLELTIGRMHFVGNAYYEFGAIVEPLYLLLALSSSLAYVMPLVYVAVRGPVSLDVVRVLINPERHRDRIVTPAIERQSSRYIKSSANYLMARLTGACLVDGTPQKSCSKEAPVFGLSGSEHFIRLQRWRRKLELAHERDAQQVAALVAQGELVPLNRRPDRIEWLARVYGGLVALISFWSWVLIVLLLYVLPRLRLNDLEVRNGPRDLLFQAELLCFCVVLNQCFTFYMVTIIVTAIDQIQLVAAFGRMIDSLTQTLGSDQLGANWSRGLIRLIIQYELLKKQLKGTQRDINFVSAVVLMLMLTLPVLARLYLTQLALLYRYIHFVCALLGMVGCDMVLLPFCWLYARCLDMFRARSRLLAAIDGHLYALRSPQRVWAQSSSAASSLTLWRASHDEHPVCLLRREQHAHEMAVRNFAVGAQFMRLTYASLLAVHFWCGLLLAPLCMREAAHSLGASDNLLALIF